MGRKPKSLNVRKKQAPTTRSSLSEHRYSSNKHLTAAQLAQITHTENFWALILKRIDWLQREQLIEQWGFCSPEILNHPEFYDFKYMNWMLDATSRYHFAQLQICISGWDLIKQAAQENQKEFPFNNPRELFSTICLQQKESDLSGIKDGSEGGLEQQRANLRIRSHFYRDRLPAEETCKLLKMHQESSQWCNFIIYAIWDERYSSYRKSPTSRTMRETWQDFLKAHKNFTAFWCNKSDVDGYRLSILAWRAGRGFDPKTNKQIM
jgi:quinol monooxygenase YgiN